MATPSSPPSEDEPTADVDVRRDGRRVVAGARARLEGPGPHLEKAASPLSYVELAGHPADSRDAVTQALRDGDPELRDDAALVRAWEFLTADPRTGPSPSQEVELPEGFGRWSALDLWLFTSVSHAVCPGRCPVMVRSVRVLATDAAIVCVWSEERANDAWTADVAVRGGPGVIPLPERKRRHSYRWSTDREDGRSEAGRLIQDTIQHHEWSASQLTQRMEQWERDFYDQASAQNTFFDGIAIDELRGQLAEVARADLSLRTCVRDLDRRATLRYLEAFAPEDPEGLVREVRERLAVLEQRCENVRTSVREGFSLLASAASGAQVELQERFQVAAGIVTAFVLIPGLAAGLYGASVSGLPGQRRTDGLIYLGAYSLVGAAGTLGVLHFARRRAWIAVAAICAATIGAMAVVSVLA